MCVVLASGQFFGNGFGQDFGYSGYNALSGDFGGPTAFSGSLGVGSTNVRDPRQNRGMCKSVHFHRIYISFAHFTFSKKKKTQRIFCRDKRNVYFKSFQ